MDTLFYIVGPTGVGKSEIAVEVARRCNAEIIGADAFQVYAGLNLLSAKPAPETLRRAPHHLIGAVSLAEEYNVARYRAAAEACRDAIRARGRVALVVGGSGLYVKALTHGMSPLPEADPKVRAELEGSDLGALNARLAALDPAAAETIDRHNKRRVVRALEVCLLTGGRFSDHRAEWMRPAAARGVLLGRDPSDLERRIAGRVDAMFRAGVVDEVRAAMESPLSATARQMIGLDRIGRVMDGSLSEAEARTSIATQTRQYAKRQLTWFQREPAFARINLTGLSTAEAVERVLRAGT